MISYIRPYTPVISLLNRNKKSVIKYASNVATQAPVQPNLRIAPRIFLLCRICILSPQHIYASHIPDFVIDSNEYLSVASVMGQIRLNPDHFSPGAYQWLDILPGVDKLAIKSHITRTVTPSFAFFVNALTSASPITSW